MNSYGYIILNALHLDENKEIDGMTEVGIPATRLFIDKAGISNSGERSSYKKLVKKLHSGDVLYVNSLAGLGSSLDEIQKQWRTLITESGVDIVVLDLPILDTRTKKDATSKELIVDLVCDLLAYVYKYQSSTRKKRQNDGIALARKRGVVFGRPTKDLPSNFSELVELYKSRQITIEKLIKLCGMSKSSVYRNMSKFDFGRKADKDK